MNGIIFDCEIKRCIAPNWFKADLNSDLSTEEQLYNEKISYIYNKEWSDEYKKSKQDALHAEMFNPITGQLYEYAPSWEHYSEMGLACCGVWDLKENEFLVFFNDERYGTDIKELQELIDSREFIVGHNNVKFDNNLLKINGIDLSRTKTVDFIRMLWRKAKLSLTERTDQHRGYSLDAIAAMNGSRKSGHGVDAPVLFQKEQIGKLLRYNQKDVMILRKLFLRSLDGTLNHPITGNKIKLDLEFEND